MKHILACLLLGLCSTSSFADVHWGYSAKNGPTQWASLDSQYQACSGFNQSPINIQNTIKADLAPLKFDYQSHANAMTNNGHTIQVDFNQGASLQLDGLNFELKQFHLHTPSENVIADRRYPMELHLVHAHSSGALAVVAIMFDEGEHNAKLDALWKLLPKKAGERVTAPEQISAEQFLPEQRSYYRFNGSLTTPPCTEGVRWIVLKDIRHASKAQIDTISAVMGHNNSRPLQPANARLIVEN